MNQAHWQLSSSRIVTLCYHSVEVDGANDFIANKDFTWCVWIKTKDDLSGIVAKTPSQFDTDAQREKTFFLNAGTLTFNTGWVGVQTASKKPASSNCLPRQR